MILTINALKNKEILSQKERNYEILEDRFLQVRETLEDPKYEEFFEALPFNAGYFMCVALKNHDSNEVRKSLLDRDIGVISTGNLIRVAYSAVGQDKIPEIFENMYDVCNSTSS